MFTLIIIDIFSPNHMVLVKFISETLYFLFYIDTLDLLTNLFITISFPLEIFMILVFIEIIELNFLDLSTMTKRNINIRAKIEAAEDNLDEDSTNFEIRLTIDGYEIELKNNKKTEEKNDYNN